MTENGTATVTVTVTVTANEMTALAIDTGATRIDTGHPPRQTHTRKVR
jgi:hypothetical protein